MKASPARTCMYVLGWLMLLGIWTYLLLLPSSHLNDHIPISMGRRFWAAKALHLGVYALLAYTAAFLPRRATWWALLVAHAVLTEVGQHYVPGRTGELRDVFINWSGLLLGLLAGRGMAPASPSTVPAAEPSATIATTSKAAAPPPPK